MLIDLVERKLDDRAAGVEKSIDAVKSHGAQRDERVGELARRLSFTASLHDAAMARGVEALKEWTGTARASVVYDSWVEPFTEDAFFGKVKGKSNVAVVCVTADGDVFGGFYSVAATRQEMLFPDPDIFIFSLESHGRCATPMKFAVKEDKRGGASVLVLKNSKYGFLSFDGEAGWLFLGNERSTTWCQHLSEVFEGIEDTTLTGKPNGTTHRCARLVSLHFE